MLIAFLLPRANGKELGAIVPVWSRWATYAVATLVLTGTAQALVEVGTLDGLFSTTYGWLVVAKVSLVVVVLAVASLSRRLVGPVADRSPTAPRALRRIVIVEAAIAAVILGVTSVLVQTTPARTAAAESTEPTVSRVRPRTVHAARDCAGSVGGNDVHLDATRGRHRPTNMACAPSLGQGHRPSPRILPLLPLMYRQIIFPRRPGRRVPLRLSGSPRPAFAPPSPPPLNRGGVSAPVALSAVGCGHNPTWLPVDPHARGARTLFRCRSAPGRRALCSCAADGRCCGRADAEASRRRTRSWRPRPPCSSPMPPPGRARRVPFSLVERSGSPSLSIVAPLRRVGAAVAGLRYLDASPAPTVGGVAALDVDGRPCRPGRAASGPTASPGHSPDLDDTALDSLVVVRPTGAGSTHGQPRLLPGCSAPALVLLVGGLAAVMAAWAFWLPLRREVVLASSPRMFACRPILALRWGGRRPTQPRLGGATGTSTTPNWCRPEPTHGARLRMLPLVAYSPPRPYPARAPVACGSRPAAEHHP